MRIHQFPDWTEIYKSTEVENMPWYLPGIDPDLMEFIRTNNIRSGSSWIDLGTGPATQAVELQKLGFNVTATDISEHAIIRARILYPEVDFVIDNILDTRLKKKFDFVFDRGCFHVFNDEETGLYVENVVKLIKPGGYLLLKCFSDKQPESGNGPYRYSRSGIRNLFGQDFEIDSIEDTIFHGDGKNPPALFCVMKRFE